MLLCYNVSVFVLLLSSKCQRFHQPYPEYHMFNFYIESPAMNVMLRHCCQLTGTLSSQKPFIKCSCSRVFVIVVYCVVVVSDVM